MRGSGDVRRSGGRYEVAPDGTFISTDRCSEQLPFQLVVNWPALLKN
jgi:hypothetical protein